MNVLQGEIKFWRTNDYMRLITVKDSSTFNRVKIQYENIKDSHQEKVQFHCAVALQTVTMYRHNNIVYSMWVNKQQQLSA